MGGPHYPPAVITAQNAQNVYLGNLIFFILLGVAGSALVYNVVVKSLRRIRLLVCLGNDKQRYFRTPSRPWASIKQHLIYAPLWSRRHGERVRIGALELGLLPSRVQSLLLLGIIAMNVTFAAYGMEWHGVPPDNPMPEQTLLGHLRNRCGTLAVSNMIPLVVMAGRNNPLIALLNIPFDTFNLLHRWFGRIVIALAIVHVTCELTSMSVSGGKMHETGYNVFLSLIRAERFILWGFIAFLSLLTILVTTPSFIRHAFYETFLHVHIALVALILAALYIHLGDLPHHLLLVKIIVSFWAVERFIRLCSLLYRNVPLPGVRSNGSTRALVELLPGRALRVTLQVARPWRFQPGQHVYLYLPTVGLWTSHPFSVAWSGHSDFFSTGISLPYSSSDLEKGTATATTQSHSPTISNSSHHRILPTTTTTLSGANSTTAHTQTYTLILLARSPSGLTGRLYSKCQATPHSRLVLPAFIEGPYSGPTSPRTGNGLTSYGTLLLIGGGIGITSILPHLRSLLTHYHPNPSASTIATRRILLVWTLRQPHHLELIRPYMTELLALPHRRDVLRIRLYVTSPANNTKEIHSPSTTVQMFPGRPDLKEIVTSEARGGGSGAKGEAGGRAPSGSGSSSGRKASGGSGGSGDSSSEADRDGDGAAVGAMGVYVCGPGSMVDDVREAVRAVAAERAVEMVGEGFGW